MQRAKWLFAKMERPVRERDEVITCFRDGVVTLRKNRRELGFTESLQEIGYQGIRRGDLVIHAMDAFAGAIGVADSDGKSTPVYSVCKPSPRSNAYYYAHLLREMARNKWILALSKGIRQRSVDFRYSEFGNQFLPVPSFDEQAAIVRYLDRADEHISGAISAKERLIELLTEQRKATIHSAVTRGLDPNVPLKDSGVEWLGDAPAHWEVKKLRHVLKHVTERNRPDLPLLSVVREQGVILRDVDSKEENHNFIPDDLSNYKVVNSGQFAMNKMKAWQGSFGVSQHSGIVSPAYFVFDIKGVQDKFFHRAIRSKAYVPFFGRASDGVRIGQWDLSQVRMREIPFLTPPLPEQSAVVHYLDKATADIDTAIDKAQRQIDLLREYRTRLIADVVTGQVDVRGEVIAR